MNVLIKILTVTTVLAEGALTVLNIVKNED